MTEKPNIAIISIIGLTELLRGKRTFSDLLVSIVKCCCIPQTYLDEGGRGRGGGRGGVGGEEQGPEVVGPHKRK